MQYPQAAAIGAFLEALGGQRSFASSLLMPPSPVTPAFRSRMEAISMAGLWPWRRACAATAWRTCEMTRLERRSCSAHSARFVVPRQCSEASLRSSRATSPAGLAVYLRRRTLPEERQFPGHAAALAERAVIALQRGDGNNAPRCRRRRSRSSRTLVSKGMSRPRWSSRLGQGPRRWRVTWSLRGPLAAGPDFAPLYRGGALVSTTPRPVGHAYLALGDAVGARAVLRQVRDITAVSPDLGEWRNSAPN